MLKDRIKSARLAMGLTQQELADKIGVKRAAVTLWETGATKKIESSNLLAAAKALDVSPEWLSSGKGPRARLPVVGSIGVATENASAGSVREPSVNYLESARLPVRPVPVISWVSAGQWSDIADPYAPGLAEEWVITSKRLADHAFALRTRGDSMEPAIPDGAILIVDPEAEARHRSIVIVRQNDNSEATCKRLIYEGDRPAYLQPDNTRYPVLPLAPDAHIIGVVRQILIDTD